MEAFLISTGIVALAEIGDKTQLLALILAARFRKPWPIIWGILVATLLNHALAGSVGLAPTAARAFLDSDTGYDVIQAENLRAHRLGINGVPCFVLAGRHAIAGAQESEVIARLLDVALLDVALLDG